MHFVPISVRLLSQSPEAAAAVWKVRAVEQKIEGLW